MNAAKTTYQEASSGISAVSSFPARVVGYYNADGKRFDASVMRLSILLMDDGTVRKTIGR